MEQENEILFVEKSQLLKLMGWCPDCHCAAIVEGIQRQREVVHSIQFKCTNPHHSGAQPLWFTSSKLGNNYFKTNLILPAAFFLCGLTYERLCMNIKALKSGKFKITKKKNILQLLDFKF